MFTENRLYTILQSWEKWKRTSKVGYSKHIFRALPMQLVSEIISLPSALIKWDGRSGVKTNSD